MTRVTDDLNNQFELRALMDRARELFRDPQLNIEELRKIAEQVRNVSPSNHERRQFEQTLERLRTRGNRI